MSKEIHLSGGRRLFCVLAAGLFLLSGCGKTEEKDTEGTAASMESGTVEADFAYPFVAESDNGYYFWERMSQEQFYPRLMFLDRESGRVVPLCSRPDCTHEDMECNAYFRENGYNGGGVNKQYLQYYEGNLYAVGLSEDAYVSLFRIKADGSGEWEISAKLYRTDYAATGHWRTPDVLIHDSYVYFVDALQKVQKLERMPIDGGAPEVLLEGDSQASAVSVYRFKRDGEFLFFEVVSYPSDAPENIGVAVYRYDPAAGQCSLVIEGEEIQGSYSVGDGFLYYCSQEGLCRYSIQDQIAEILVDQPMDMPEITLTRDYIILCAQWKGAALTLYDYEGREVAAVPNTLNVGWYFGGNSDMLFGECWGENRSLAFLDLSRPVGELQWEELKEN